MRGLSMAQKKYYCFAILVLPAVLRLEMVPLQRYPNLEPFPAGCRGDYPCPLRREQ